MSQKKLDAYNRWRNKTVSFRMSPEEAALLDKYVAMSGHTKQEYLINCALSKKIIVHGSPRTFKALRNQMEDIISKMKMIKYNSEITQEEWLIIERLNETMYGFRNNET